MLLNKGKTSQTTGPGHSKQFLQQITSSQTWAQNHLEVLLNTGCWSTVRVSNSAGLGWGLETSISNKLPGDTDATGLGTTLGTSEINGIRMPIKISNPNCWGLQVSISGVYLTTSDYFPMFLCRTPISLIGSNCSSRSLNIKYQPVAEIWGAVQWC